MKSKWLNSVSKEDFGVSSTGVLRIYSTEAFLKIAKGLYPGMPNPQCAGGYPFTPRYTARDDIMCRTGSTELMWSEEIAQQLVEQLLEADYMEGMVFTPQNYIVDPLIQNGTLIMTQPANTPQQNLRWAK